jgi:hypothetical protein
MRKKQAEQAKTDPVVQRATAREVQRSLFARSLGQHLGQHLDEQLTRIAASQSKLLAAAKTYLNQGMSASETSELLVIDGFHRDAVQSCMAQMSEPHVETTDSSKRWGFDAENVHGAIYSSSDLQLSVEASSEEEAWEKAEARIATADASLNLERILSVYEI